MDIFHVISLGISAASVVLSIASIVYFSGVKIAKLEVKVDTIWDFLMRRAMSEAIVRGAGTINSPFIITPEAMLWLDNMKSDLQAFYKEKGRLLQEDELLLALEKEFGARLLKEVCIPRGMLPGVCLLLASAVAKETTVINVSV